MHSPSLTLLIAHAGDAAKTRGAAPASLQSRKAAVSESVLVPLPELESGFTKYGPERFHRSNDVYNLIDSAYICNICTLCVCLLWNHDLMSHEVCVVEIVNPPAETRCLAKPIIQRLVSQDVLHGQNIFVYCFHVDNAQVSTYVIQVHL